MATLNPPFESDKGPFGLFLKIQNKEIQRFNSRYNDKLFNLIRSVIKKDPSKQPSIKEILEKSKQFSK
mgnify:CR=1 FL=1